MSFGFLNRFSDLQKALVAALVLGTGCFGAGFGFKDYTEQAVNVPRELSRVSARLDTLTTLTTALTTTAVRLTWIEDTICDPAAVEDAGPQRRRYCDNIAFYRSLPPMVPSSMNGGPQ